MEAITEQYKTMSAENGVFGTLYPGYAKHDFQVYLSTILTLTFITRFMLGALVKPPAI